MSVGIRKIQETSGLSFGNVTGGQLNAQLAYVVIEVPGPSSASDSTRRTLNAPRQIKVLLADLLTIPGIAANLPTTDPGITGSLWNDGGIFKISV